MAVNLRIYETQSREDAMSLLDSLQGHLDSNEVENISQQLGVDPTTAQRAIDAALPMMVAGMAHTAQQPGGEQALTAAAQSGGVAQALGGLGGMLGGAGGGAGLGGILGSILGQHHSTVSDGVQQASGLDAGKAGKLLMLLAPFVLRALVKHQESQPAGSADGGLAGQLGREAQNSAAAAHPQIGGVLGKILAGIS